MGHQRKNFKKCPLTFCSCKSTRSSDCGGMPESIYACICYHWEKGSSTAWEAYMSIWHNSSNTTNMPDRHSQPHTGSGACQWTSGFETEARSPTNDPHLNKSPWQRHCSCSQLLPKPTVETGVHRHSYLIQWSAHCGKLMNTEIFMLRRWILFWGMVYFEDFH